MYINYTSSLFTLLTLFNVQYIIVYNDNYTIITTVITKTITVRYLKLKTFYLIIIIIIKTVSNKKKRNRVRLKQGKTEREREGELESCTESKQCHILRYAYIYNSWLDLQSYTILHTFSISLLIHD